MNGSYMVMTSCQKILEYKKSVITLREDLFLTTNMAAIYTESILLIHFLMDIFFHKVSHITTQLIILDLYYEGVDKQSLRHTRPNSI